MTKKKRPKLKVLRKDAKRDVLPIRDEPEPKLVVKDQGSAVEFSVEFPPELKPLKVRREDG